MSKYVLHFIIEVQLSKLVSVHPAREWLSKSEFEPRTFFFFFYHSSLFSKMLIEEGLLQPLGGISLDSIHSFFSQKSSGFPCMGAGRKDHTPSCNPQGLGSRSRGHGPGLSSLVCCTQGHTDWFRHGLVTQVMGP